MKKLTKDQRYYRKKRKDGERDIRKTKREDGREGVRVTRKPLSVKISTEAFERLVEMADEAGIKRWEMLTRMINLGLPSYLSYSTSLSPTKRYEWDEILLRGLDKDSGKKVEIEGSIYVFYDRSKIKYKGATGDKQITYDITSTAWKTLQCHKTASGLSKARIVQFLILNYKPKTKIELEREKLRREEYMRENEYYQSGGKFYKEYKHSKFIDCGGGHIIHKKDIPMEHWDDAEWDEYCRINEKNWELMKQKLLDREIELEEFLKRFPRPS